VGTTFESDSPDQRLDGFVPEPGRGVLLVAAGLLALAARPTRQW